MRHIKLFENFQSLDEAAFKPDAVKTKALREVQKAPKKLGNQDEKKYNTIELAFIKHMEEELSWNGAEVKKYVNNIEWVYGCYEGSSVIKDIKEAAKKFGVKIDVEKIDNDWYEFTVVDIAAINKLKTEKVL